MISSVSSNLPVSHLQPQSVPAQAPVAKAAQPAADTVSLSSAAQARPSVDVDHDGDSH